ncbi:chromosome partitioning protein ParB [Nonomuraea purpurea]|uniref:Chromosome partitioning protein ParB n=1 Tax=Nonomuraea purpurea TaxID=1849276 RepID=A0ABV8G862_9ACTN
MRVIDGMHRLRAAVLRGRTAVCVRFFDGTEADAFVLSVQLNVRHGLPLTLDERKAAAQRIIGSHPHWSDRAIAERTGLSAKTVGKVRRLAGQASHLPSRLGRDGRSRPVSSIDARRSAAAMLAANSEISLRELSRKTGLSVGTVRDVRDRVGRGQDPVPERLRGEEDPAPQARRRAEAHRPQHDAAAVAETSLLIRKLTRDPSLRATETGRLLLRMLLTTEVAAAHRAQIAEAVPTHCAPLIRAALLRFCEDLKGLAHMMPPQREQSLR